MIEINVAVVVAVVADSLQPGSSAARPDGSGTQPNGRLSHLAVLAFTGVETEIER